MSRIETPISALEEIRQLNQFFLEYLRERRVARDDSFGLPAVVAELLESASPEQIEQAASFPRALFRLCLPPGMPDAVRDPLAAARETRGQVLKLVLLNSARNFSRTSGYSARLLLWLTDDDVTRLRAAEVDQIVAWSRFDGIVRAAFDDLDWLWRELLTEMRPEYRRRLLLIGLQPVVSIQPAAGFA
jgi:hypothetical protein